MLLLSLPFFPLFVIAMEYAELQMLLPAVFFLIPGVIYSFPSCKNNLFIPFLSPAWDGSHFPHSLVLSQLPAHLCALSQLQSFPSPESCQAVLSSSREMVVSAEVSLCWINCKPPYSFQGKQYSALTFPGWFGGSFISLVVSSQSK